MSITSKDGILKVLTAYNPWWKTGVVNPKMTKTYKRFAFHEAIKGKRYSKNRCAHRNTSSGKDDNSVSDD